MTGCMDEGVDAYGWRCGHRGRRGLNDWCMGESTGKNGIGGWREQAARTDGMSGVEHDE